MEYKGDLHPQIVLEDSSGKILDFYYLPEKAHIEVSEGAPISAGTLLAKTPREVSGTQDITGGLPRVTEIFEARKPKEPAVIAEIDGLVELLGEKRRGKRTIIVRSESGIEREHLVAHGKHLRVHAGDLVRAGEALVDGPLVPHDILYRPKMGFGVPLKQWFRGPLREPLRRAVLGEPLNDSGLFDRRELEGMVEQHQSGVRDHSAPLWSALMFGSFLRRIG